MYQQHGVLNILLMYTAAQWVCGGEGLMPVSDTASAQTSELHATHANMPRINLMLPKLQHHCRSAGHEVGRMAPYLPLLSR
jgi:hypothetical protein